MTEPWLEYKAEGAAQETPPWMEYQRENGQAETTPTPRSTIDQISQGISNITPAGMVMDAFNDPQKLLVAARQFKQGATFNAADEIQSAIGATAARALVPGSDWQGLYDEAMRQQSQDLQQDAANYPGTSFGANLAGALPALGMTKLAIGKTMPALGRYLGSAETWAGARGRDIITGATGGAIAGGLGAEPGQRGSGALLGGMVGGVVTPAIGAALGGKIPSKGLDDLIPQGYDLPPDELGDKLGTGVLGKYEASEQAANAAIEAAKPAAKGTRYPKEFGLELVNHVRKTMQAEELINDITNPNILSVNNILDRFENLMNKPNVKAGSWQAIWDMEKSLNKAYKNNRKDYRPITVAKDAINQIKDKILEKGLLEGDDNAISMIRGANKKYSEHMQTFVDKGKANKVIRDYVANEGDNLTPENLLQKFVNLKQAGYDNVTAAKDILGNDVVPILKSGYAQMLKKAGTDATGKVNPKALAKQIEALVNGNPTLSREVFTSEELKILNGVRETAQRLSKNSKPGLFTRFYDKLSKMPLVPFPERPELSIEDVAPKVRRKTTYGNVPEPKRTEIHLRSIPDSPGYEDWLRQQGY